MNTIDISAVTARYQTLNTEYEALVEKATAELHDEIRKTLGNVLKMFFEANPHVASISWAQYTPYFNDGDACEFEAGERRFTLRDAGSPASDEGDDSSGEDDEDYEDGEDDEAELNRDDSTLLSSRAFYSKGGYKDPARVARIDAQLSQIGGDEAFEKIRRDFVVVSEFIGGIDEAHLEEMFGDHVQVCCTPEGIKVFKYHEHD